jgi:molybdopterin synthase sulfur carrier subunit
VKIKYFAWLGEKVGCAEEEISLPAKVKNVGMLINWLSVRGPRYEEAFEFIEVIKVVVNQTYVHNDQVVSDDDEVIFIPPIAGG